MEGSESESERERVFESLNLNPRLLVNEVLNTVENLLDDSFDFYHQEASKLLNIEEDEGSSSDRAQHLAQGIDGIRNAIQSNVGKRLGIWEEYCFRHCFSVPPDLSLPKNDSSSLIRQDVLWDSDLDAQLESLRDKINLTVKEIAELNHELKVLERQSARTDSNAALVNEALQFYEQNSMNEMLQEMVKTASELRIKVEKLRTRRVENTDRSRIKKICDPKSDFSAPNHGLCNAKLEDLQGFVADLKM